MKTVLLIVVCIINSAQARNHHFTTTSADDSKSPLKRGSSSVLTKKSGKLYSSSSGASQNENLMSSKKGKSFATYLNNKSVSRMPVAFSSNHTAGTRKNIPVSGDGGIYYFNTNGFFQPGDTACIVADHEYPYIYLSGFVGTAANPIVIINTGGQVICHGTSYSYNIINSRYFRFTGTGVSGIFYGFKADGKGIATPAGMSVRDSSTDYEIDHMEATRVSIGVLAKINAVSCSPGTYSTGWTIRNVSIHDNYVHNSEGEGFYLGHTFTTDQVNDCNGNPITVENIKIDGIQVYNNITDSTGWDGIQIAASRHADIHHNKVTNYGLVNMGSQQAGMIFGAKSTGSIHDNFIKDGTGEGMQVFGYGIDGPVKVYNNVIVNAGFDGTSNRQSALGIDDRPDPGNQYTGLVVQVVNNTIVNSGRNNMIINNSYNTMGTGNKVYNNLLVLPNNTSIYDADKYIKANSNLSLDSTNNYENMVIANAKFVSGTDYHLQSTSPAISIGLNASSYGVTKDIDGTLRPQGAAYDAGAYEYNSGTPPPNQSPIANAGNDTAITLPTNSATLTGSATDNDGTISSYTWTKTSGPSGGTITSPGSASTSISSLVQGNYSYVLSVTDNNGATGKDTVQVIVNAAGNKVPTADAGSNVTITLPTNSVTLSGNGIDNDGTISSYSWTKISGPSGGTISSPGFASTSVTGLVQGSYSYVLVVTDNNSATGKDTMQVTVNAAGNKVPIANAGTDVTITLPTSSTTLSGNGTDSDGTINSYSWKKISGPSSGSISSPASASTLVSGLVKGAYKYALTVTDNSGATAKDTIIITVKAAGNKAPTALAGSDVTIVLPVNSTTLSGSGTDNDGTISSYIWSKISGPSSGTISTPALASTLISGLAEGNYVYSLTVTDNKGAIAKDTVMITVNAGGILGGKYYFSANSGDDSRTTTQAQNPSTPWKTLDKLNSFFSSLKAGDSVLFKRGETFYGAITVNISGSLSQPIVLGAYGTGAKPVIEGFTTLSNWTSVGNNIYESYNSALGTTANIVTINGAQQPVGRYPNYNSANKGYLTFESHGTNYIVDNQLTSAINWNSAEVVVRPKRWILDRTLITTHSGTKITFSPALTYDPYDNYGYFIQNHIKTLDQPGEWYYNPSTRKISVFSIPGTFKASTINVLVTINNKSNIVFDNLAFTGSNQKAFDLYYTNNIRISNCDIMFSGIDGIFGSTTTNFILENSTVTNTNNNAINLNYNANGCIIRNNVIRNTGIYPGLGTSGNGTYQAIALSGKSNLIEYNEIDSTGFTAIKFQGGDSNVVRNNLVNYFTFVKDDGGGINTGVTNGLTYYGQKITNNIILNGIGAAEGTDKPGTSSSNGIYMDDNTANVEITGNSVSNCGNSGIILHNSSKITVRNNTFFNNANQLQLIHDLGRPDALPRNYTIRNNILFSKTPVQIASNLSTLSDDIKLIGNLDTNFYCRPVDDNLVIKSSFVNTTGTRVDQVLDLKGWQTNYAPYESAAKKTPVQVPAYIVTNTGANKIPNGIFNTNNSGLYTSTSSSWISNKLDGGTFQATNASSTTSSYYVIIAAGAIEAGKNYLIKFSSQSVKDTIVTVYLRMSGAPYSNLSDVKTFKISASRQEHEFLFTLPTASSLASVIFETKCPRLTFWLDNIQLTEATVTLPNPDDYIKFEYNSSQTAKVVPLSGTYVDSRNNEYANTITIAPYSSAVLVKRTSLSRPDVPETDLGETDSMMRIGNDKWLAYNGKSIIPLTSETSIIPLSQKRISFLPDSSNIIVNDKNLGAGNSSTSKHNKNDKKSGNDKNETAFERQNIHLEVVPNPTHTTLFVAMKGLETGIGFRIYVLTLSGAMLRTYYVSTSSQTIPVDISTLTNGLYILKAVVETYSGSKQFVKI